MRLPGPQSLRESAQKPIQARVVHLQDAADVGRALPVQELRGFGGVPIAGVGAVTLPVEEPQREEGVKEVVDPPRVQAQPVPDLLASHRLGTQMLEQP